MQESLRHSKNNATASFFYENVEPDNKDGFVKGIRGFLAEGGTPPKDAWGSLSAWAWGASRVLDYLESLDSIDTSRTAVSGHSRLGTAALWAACEDNRFAVVYSNCSGSTGAAITHRQFGLHARLSFGEFPLWYSSVFFDSFLQGQELPFDQHELIALIAPRGVYVSSADRDLAADPKGEYTSLVEAAPVFRLLQKECVEEYEMPPLDHPRVRGVTGYHIRTGKHNLTYSDWKWFLDFTGTLLK